MCRIIAVHSFQLNSILKHFLFQLDLMLRLNDPHAATAQALNGNSSSKAAIIFKQEFCVTGGKQFLGQRTDLDSIQLQLTDSSGSIRFLRLNQQHADSLICRFIRPEPGWVKLQLISNAKWKDAESAELSLPAYWVVDDDYIQSVCKDPLNNRIQSAAVAHGLRPMLIPSTTTSKPWKMSYWYTIPPMSKPVTTGISSATIFGKNKEGCVLSKNN
jgi:hypothetical protein